MILLAVLGRERIESESIVELLSRDIIGDFALEKRCPSSPSVLKRSREEARELRDATASCTSSFAALGFLEIDVNTKIEIILRLNVANIWDDLPSLPLRPDATELFREISPPCERASEDVDACEELLKTDGTPAVF
jgi:hypothetical protein